MSGRSTSDLGPAADPVGWRWPALFAVTYSLLHHQGFVLGRLGEMGSSGTRWADWFDLLTPYLVVIPAGLALRSIGITARQWLPFLVGVIAYVEGHGMHLSANSISNVMDASAAETGPAPAVVDDVVHIWDELIGHFFWYGGVSVIVAVLVGSFGAQRLPATGPSTVVGVGLAALVGVTYATNSLEGHFAVPGLLFSMAVVVWSVRRRRWTGKPVYPVTGGDLAGLTFGLAFFLLGFYGIWHRGFPDPTSVGWNILAP